MHGPLIPLTILLSCVTLWAAPAGRGPAGVAANDPASAAERWAVIIGVNEYEDARSFGKLKLCVADAKALYRALVADGGFGRDNVALLTDDAIDRRLRPTAVAIRTELSNWLTLAGPDDTVLVYFAGHGAERNGVCYLLPIDARGTDLELTALSLKHVKDMLRSCKAKNKILVLDACHSAAGARAVGEMSPALLREIEDSQGMVTLTSCGAKEKSHEWGESGHGAFTYFFLEALRGKADDNADQRVWVSEACRYVQMQMRRWAVREGVKQTPRLFVEDVVGEILLTVPGGIMPPVITEPADRGGRGGHYTAAAAAVGILAVALVVLVRRKSRRARRAHYAAETEHLDVVGAARPTPQRGEPKTGGTSQETVGIAAPNDNEAARGQSISVRVSKSMMDPCNRHPIVPRESLHMFPEQGTVFALETQEGETIQAFMGNGETFRHIHSGRGSGMGNWWKGNAVSEGDAITIEKLAHRRYRMSVSRGTGEHAEEEKNID